MQESFPVVSMWEKKIYHPIIHLVVWDAQRGHICMRTHWTSQQVFYCFPPIFTVDTVCYWTGWEACAAAPLRKGLPFGQCGRKKKYHLDVDLKVCDAHVIKHLPKELRIIDALDTSAWNYTGLPSMFWEQLAGWRSSSGRGAMETSTVRQISISMGLLLVAYPWQTLTLKALYQKVFL